MRPHDNESETVRHFATYFDVGYFSRGYALYASLVRHCRSFELWALCLDPDAESAVKALQLPHVHAISLATLEEADPELAATKATRSRVEYYFTCTAALLLYVLRHDRSIQQLTYVDADLCFFSSPQPAFDEIADSSIAITAHRFLPRHRALEAIYGRYNVGWLTFRNDDVALGCLSTWREQCLEWCYDRSESNRYADQMYLDEWPERFKGTRVLNIKGVNLAPFNVGNYQLRRSGSDVSVDGEPLICFHFAGLKELAGTVYYLSVERYGGAPSNALIGGVYEPYFRALKDGRRLLRDAGVGGHGRRQFSERRRWVEAVGIERIGSALKGLERVSVAIAKRRVLIFDGDHVVLKSLVCRES